MKVVIASCSAMPPEFRDDQVLSARLAERGVEAEILAWDRPDFDGSPPDLVVVRSTWDYSLRRDEFLAWTRQIGERLHNSPALIAWNSDKRYIEDLAGAGLPVVATRYIEPGEHWTPPDGEFVVKPSISAGGRNTGRFGPESAAIARGLVESLHAEGRTVMVQPFQPAVDSAGETALIFIAGEFSHALRKKAVLRADEVAPIRDDGIRAAEAMYDPGLVSAATATEEELDLGARVLSHVEERFGYRPLYARVDMLPGAGGEPTLLELEAVEPNLYFDLVPESAERLADAIAQRARANRGS